ncbi:MAG: disulfide bond formation protein DsbA [Alphaproteobacteria bacterium 41-28]|nr:MAG: disulfide bond formation protein DsbA [Alphaproteobacteria bacterium 41-28]
MLKVPITVDDHIEGDLNAPFTLVEYGDYECPFCEMVSPIIKRVQKHFGKQLTFVYRNFPQTEMHPYAEIAAEAAELAGSHGHFWEMHDLIYENQEALSLELLFELVEKLGLSRTDLKNTLENKTFEKKIRNDFNGGVRSGVNGTPTFFINDLRYNGSFEYDELISALNHTII